MSKLDKSELAEAKRQYRRFHWGNEPETVTAAQAPRVKPGDVLVVLGELHAVEYEGDKGGTDAIWCHDFKADKPILCATVDGRLVIVGGSYRVTERGIVG